MNAYRGESQSQSVDLMGGLNDEPNAGKSILGKDVMCSPSLREIIKECQ